MNETLYTFTVDGCDYTIVRNDAGQWLLLYKGVYFVRVLREFEIALIKINPEKK